MCFTGYWMQVEILASKNFPFSSIVYFWKYSHFERKLNSGITVRGFPWMRNIEMIAYTAHIASTSLTNVFLLT